MSESTVVRPIAGVSICVVRDGKALLVRRNVKSAFGGQWSLPGGKVEFGEPLREAVLRELYEETRTRAEIIRLLDCIDIIHKSAAGALEAHYVLSVFGGRWTSGRAKKGSDASEVRWCGTQDLAQLHMTPGTPELIRRAIPALTKN